MNKINKLIEGLEKLTGKIVRLESKEAAWSKQMDKVVKPQFNEQSKNPRSSSSGNASYDEKDMRRIEDIIKKAGGNREKEERLATIMANKITDKAKAIRRAKAAEDENYHNIAKIFYNRAKMLN
jgi:hypothetical protein